MVSYLGSIGRGGSDKVARWVRGRCEGGRGRGCMVERLYLLAGR